MSGAENNQGGASITNGDVDQNQPSTSTDEVNDEKPSSSSDYIRVRVMSDGSSNEINFRVKPSGSFRRLKHTYCSKVGIQVEETRFIFDGQRIRDEDTPESLGMIDDDVIEVYQERTGGN